MWDQYANMLTLATALSLAGPWMSQYPASPQNMFQNNNTSLYGSNNYNYHPYYRDPPTLSSDNGYIHHQPWQGYHRQQSKDAQTGFQSYIELRDLLNWQDSYYRGDLNLNSRSHYNVLPLMNNDEKNEESHPSTNDEGYSSSVGSPSHSSVSSRTSGFNGDISSPNPSLFLDEQNFAYQFDQDEVQGAIGYSDNFDIDALLFNDDASFESDKMATYDLMDAPATRTTGGRGVFLEDPVQDADLEYVDSPLKDPVFDEFLASPNPDFDPTSGTTTTVFQDPMNMQFTNMTTSIKDKAMTDLLNFDDFDLMNIKLEEDDQLSLETLKELASLNNYGYGNFKKEVLSPGKSSTRRYGMDHDYATSSKTTEFKPSSKVEPTTTPLDFKSLQDQQPRRKTFTPVSKNNVNFSTASAKPKSQALSFKPTSSAAAKIKEHPMRQTFEPQRRSRTFAPTSNDSKQRNMKTQQSKQKLVWPDFPYTNDELITMPVEKFNEVIEKLSEIRKHVARDIRRKGKNKFAARDCRQRKVDTIISLDMNVDQLLKKQTQLKAERHRIVDETAQIKRKTQWLNNYIFEHMRSPNGSTYSPHDYSLQYTADGNVYLVPTIGGEKK